MYWNEPERNIDDEDWLVIAPNGQIAAFMELYQYAPYTVFEVDFHVLPAYDGLGIEAVLLDLIERRSRREMHRAADDERVALHTYASSKDTSTQQHLEAAGFTHIRDHLEMVIELADRGEPFVPEGITFRPMVRNQDERAVWETADTAWIDHWGYAPMPFEEFCYFHIDSHPTFDPSLWHLALDGEVVAGVALCRAERGGLESTGWVSVLAVRREYRGRGIGQALLLRAFDDFAQRGYARVGLGVDASSLTGADRLYRRVGMHEVSRERTYEKVLREATQVAETEPVTSVS
jgi:GNAT superfamily N-acetyltransferase